MKALQARRNSGRLASCSSAASEACASANACAARNTPRLQWPVQRRQAAAKRCQAAAKPMAAAPSASAGDGTPASGPGKRPQRHGKRSQPDPVREMKLELPTPEFSRVQSSAYVSSSVTLAGCPPPKLPEFAVIGRSNVGKSSLINLITQNDKLARVSKEPGMTKTINHFLINNTWYLVDLPGYGYAKSGRQQRLSWMDFTKQYFLERDSLVSVLLLVDASLAPQQVDVDCANWLGEAQVPFALVFTKTDARKKGAATPSANVLAFKRALLQDWEAVPPTFLTSARTGEGRVEVLQYLAALRQLHLQGGITARS